MNNSELFALVRSQFPDIQEIPAPVAPANLPAHEGKPYRDPYLYLSCEPQKWPALAQLLRNDPQLSFDFLTVVTALDYLKVTAPEKPHFDLVYHLYSLQYQHKLVVKVSLPRENASVPSVVPLWSAADWQEREVYDMFGIQFEGHPNLSRILMWEGFPGWPLRKDYAHVPDRYDD